MGFAGVEALSEKHEVTKCPLNPTVAGSELPLQVQEIHALVHVLDRIATCLEQFRDGDLEPTIKIKNTTDDKGRPDNLDVQVYGVRD